jgi:hypothetical protein
MSQYRAVDVWRRLGDGRVVRFRCFQTMPDGRFCVQSADFFEAPVSRERLLQLEQQYVELLLEAAPDDRAETHESLEAAIRAHEEDFG